MIEIYTDGSCKGNGTENALGGWAAIVYIDGVIKSVSAGTEKNSTNNICELKPIIWAVGHYGDRHPTVYTDSAYAFNALTNWRHAWKANGWRRKNNGEIKNLEYIQAFDKMESMGLTINLVKVKGHANCKGNILADKLATGEMTISQVMDSQ